MKKIEKIVLNGKAWRNIRWLMLTIILFGPYLSKAQDKKINISMKDTSVLAVITEIINQSEVNFIFNHEELNKQPKISIDVKNATLSEALEICLVNTSLGFVMVKNTVVIKPKKNIEGFNNVPVKTQTLRGRIVDRETKKSLPFANVVVLNSIPQRGTTTNEDGNFRIEDLPVGRYVIQISYLGYEKAVLPEILIGAAKEKVLEIELSEITQDMDEVTVSVMKGQPLNEMASISAKSFSVEETKRYPASISDPARMVQSFAGVATSDDASNEIVIRGNSPNWLLWRLEGVEIPSPNHFAEEGFIAGAVSILSTNMLGKSDFYTGAFPAEYGGALSGVFDLRLRNGNNEKREYSAQVGILGAEFAAEGPLKKGYRGSYLFNYRYSTLSLLDKINVEVSENAHPRYQDLSFKFYLPSKNAGTFSIWGIGGNSSTDETFEPDTLLNEDLDEGYIDNTKTGMFATGIGHSIYLGENSYLKSVLSYSGSYSENDVAQMDTKGIFVDDYKDDFSSEALRFNTFYNNKISKKLTVRIGGNLSWLGYNYFMQRTDNLAIWKTEINSKGNANIYKAYLQSKYKFSDDVVFTAGLHYMHFALSSDNSVEPRLGLQVGLPKQQKVSFGFGVHSKNENLPAYFLEYKNDDGTVSFLNKNLKLTRSIHYVASYEKLFNKDWAFKAEAYYQDITNLPVSSNPERPLSPAFHGISSEDTLVNNGRGKNYGIEFTLQKFFTNNYYLLFTTSLFESKYKTVTDRWYNSRYNLNHVSNLVGGKEIKWGDDKMLSLNGKLLWTGGQRFLPIDMDASKQEGETKYELRNAYSQKGSDYFRIDVGVKAHFYKTKMEHIVAIEVQNLTNRLNTWYQVYDKKNDKVIDYPMAGLIPVISYRLEF